MTTDIAVIGAGSYGTCLAMLFGRADHRVELWCRDEARAKTIEDARENAAYLPGYKLPDTVHATHDLERAVAELVDAANRNGGTDNITTLLLQCLAA